MTSKLNKKIEDEMATFMAKMEAGFTPDAAFKAVLRRILKEQDRDTRHACAEAVLQTYSTGEAHDACINCDTFN